MAILGFLFSFRGTAGRGAAMAVLAAALMLQAGGALLGQHGPQYQRFVYPALALSWAALLAVSARRAHQAGQSGLWAAGVLLPVVGYGVAAVLALLPQRRAQLHAHDGARAAGYGVIVALLLWGLWRLWWTPLWVVWLDMQPSLWVGDYVVMRAGVRPGDLAAGDVLAIWNGADTAPKLMRLIGRAGDKVALQGGQVWLNGAPLRQLPRGEFAQIMEPLGPLALRPKCQNGLVGDGAICRNAQAREIGPAGRGYMIVASAPGAGDDMAPLEVPLGMLFVLGDNRDDSLDSRHDAAVGGLGLVAQSQVLGRVDRVILSSPAASWLQIWGWRWGRIWQRVE